MLKQLDIFLQYKLGFILIYKSVGNANEFKTDGAQNINKTMAQELKLNILQIISDSAPCRPRAQEVLNEFKTCKWMVLQSR
jgi:hypothetical protein